MISTLQRSGACKNERNKMIEGNDITILTQCKTNAFKDCIGDLFNSQINQEIASIVVRFSNKVLFDFMFFSELLLDYYSLKVVEVARLSAYMRVYVYVCTLNVWAWQRERERERFIFQMFT